MVHKNVDRDKAIAALVDYVETAPNGAEGLTTLRDELNRCLALIEEKLTTVIDREAKIFIENFVQKGGR